MRVFDEIFDEYTRTHELIKVKTTDLGSLFQLIFTVTLDTSKSQKAF